MPSLQDKVSTAQSAKQAKQGVARLDSWGEFYCPRTEGWTPVQERNDIWPGPQHMDSRLCLGVAARFREAVRADPAFADTKLPAFTGEALKEEQMHIR
jgi:hypothetical protein